MTYNTRGREDEDHLGKEGGGGKAYQEVTAKCIVNRYVHIRTYTYCSTGLERVLLLQGLGYCYQVC